MIESGVVPTTVTGEKARSAQAAGRRETKMEGQQQVAYGRISEQRLAVNVRGFKTLQVRLDLSESGRGSLQGQGSEKHWYGLAYPPDVIALIFGSSLVNRRAMLVYNTVDPKGGIVYIVHNRFFEGDTDEAMEPAKVGGRVLAKAGSGI